MTQRNFIIGDIHGCIHKLENLLVKMPVNWAYDRLIFLGDYIDRGESSKDVIDFLIALKRKHEDKIILLKGNHELMFMDFINGGQMAQAFVNFGGMRTLYSYGLSPDDAGKGPEIIPPSHWTFFNSLKEYHATENFFMVHAGVRPDVPLALQKSSDMLWIRDQFINSSYDWGKRIIFGHTIFNSPLIMKNKIGIDTGAVYGGMLTCLVIPEIDFIFE